MKINDIPYRTIWPNKNNRSITILDQTKFPHQLEELEITNLDEAAHAISSMQVRGAPLVGATAAYGIALALLDNTSDGHLEKAAQILAATRPTAINLQWALDQMLNQLLPLKENERLYTSWQLAANICDEDVETNSLIGDFGLKLIEEIAAKKTKGEAVNILTHCNAGWLATVDWGTATSPIYKAYDKGIPIHVYVDETRPRNQGAYLTTWELKQHGVPHKLIVDNAGGHLMQHGEIDMVIVGSDRTTNQGDVCNKIGTYLKALAAKDNNIPFYVALPTPSIDFDTRDGLAEIPIEERSMEEVTVISGKAADGSIVDVNIAPDDTKVSNPGFDITPARLVTGLITEKGIFDASVSGLKALKQKL